MCFVLAYYVSVMYQAYSVSGFSLTQKTKEQLIAVIFRLLYLGYRSRQ